MSAGIDGGIDGGGRTNSASQRKRHVQFEVELPQIKWLQQFPSEDDGSYSSYGSDSWGSSVTSYTLSSYGTNPSRESSSRGDSRSQSVASSSTDWSGRRSTSYPRSLSSRHRMWPEAAAAAGFDVSSMYSASTGASSSSSGQSIGANGNGANYTHSSSHRRDDIPVPAKQGPPTYPRTTCSGESNPSVVSGMSSSSARIMKNLKRAASPARITWKLSNTDSDTAAAVAKPPGGTNSNGDGTHQRQQTQGAIDVKNAEPQKQKKISRVVSGILRKSKYKAAKQRPEMCDEIGGGGIDIESNQLKEDLSHLAGEAATSLSLAFETIGAETEDIADQFCKMGLPGMQEEVSLSENGFEDYKRYEQYRRYLRRSERRRRKESGCWEKEKAP